MQKIKVFFKPDLGKILLFGVFLLISAGGGIQAWVFTKVSPKPVLYDILQYFPLWHIWVMVLLLPLHLISMVFGIIGINLRSGPAYWAGGIISAYFLSCLFLVSFRNYAGRFGKWLWALVILLPVVVGEFVPFFEYFSVLSLLRGRDSLMSQMSDLYGLLLIVWVYEYFFVCAIFYAYDALGRIKVNPALSNPERNKESS